MPNLNSEEASIDEIILPASLDELPVSEVIQVEEAPATPEDEAAAATLKIVQDIANHPTIQRAYAERQDVFNDYAVVANDLAVIMQARARELKRIDSLEKARAKKGA